MMNSLVISCSLDKEAKVEELLIAVRKVSQLIAVRLGEIDADYEVEDNIDAIILSQNSKPFS
jgi:hypothetical protein